MRTARFWVRATVTIDGVEDSRGGVVGLGWSDTGVESARRVALERARRAAARLRADETPKPWGYPYPDRPIREPVVEQIQDNGRIIGVITRNSYGALILNTVDAMFIDIDLPVGRGGWLGSLLSRDNAAGEHTQQTVAKLQSLCEDDPGLGLRLYRTAAGLRVLVTSQTIDPKSDHATDLMQQTDADPRYVQLCRTQACFRARLTPKPWRCGVERVGPIFPYETERETNLFKKWLRTYEAATATFGVCELVAHIGSEDTHPAIRPILTWHDELACRDGLALA